MADRILSKCRIILPCSYRFCRVHRNKVTRYTSNIEPISRYGESKVTFVTEDCTLEELEAVQDLFTKNLEVHENIVSQEEENQLVKEIEPYFKAMKYQYDHWDDAICGYRETEKSRWTEENLKLFKKIKEMAFKPDTKILPYIHVLDLAKNGFIKPHIDSVKFCGSTIAGLSLLSPSVMRFVHDEHSAVKVDVLLSPRSLYIMRDAVRFEFTHEILKEQESCWRGRKVSRDRRIALLMRCEPYDI